MAHDTRREVTMWHEVKKHTVSHYIYECPELENVREKCENKSEIRIYMENAIIIRKILELYPRFAPPR